MTMIVAGISGSGKTTAVQNLKTDCIDRHKGMDDLIFGNVEFPAELEGAADTVVLTATLTTLEKRAHCTRRYLYYFDRKYKEIAAHYGIPVIDTTNLTPDALVWAVRRNKRPEVPLKDMTAEYVENNFELVCKGKSKKIYQDPLSAGHVYIIGGHTTRFFMDLMFRNEINHAYVAVNDKGVIYSRKMENINPLEISVKEYIEEPEYEERYGSIDGRYPNGPYVKFEWNGKTVNEAVVNSCRALKKETLKLYFTIRDTPIKDMTIAISEESDGLTVWKGTQQVFTDVLPRRYNVNTPVWCYDYHPGMVEMLSTYCEPVNEDIYMECVTTPGSFVVAGKSMMGFQDTLLYEYKPGESATYQAVKSIHEVTSAQRVLIPSFEDHSEYIKLYGASRVIVPVYSYDMVCELAQHEDIAIMLYERNIAVDLMLGFPSMKRFIYCDNILDVHSAWGTGMVSVISPALEEQTARGTFTKPTIVVVYQNVDGTVMSIDTDVRVKEFVFKRDGRRHLIGDNSIVVQLK